MKILGNEVHIQRGETWSLDFAIADPKGHPYVVLKNWKNPYIAITVTAALYEQAGDYRETYWLDLSRRYVEKSDGSIVLEDFKRFISSEILWLENGFSVEEAIENYGIEAGGKIVLDPTSDFDVTNFLFFCDPYSDGNYIYKYVDSYTLQGGEATNVVWADYDFRVVKQFNTKSWMEQRYLFDIKVLAGESVQEYLIGVLETQGVSGLKESTIWDNNDWEYYISLVTDENVRREIQELYDEGVPLMPSYDAKTLLLEPTPIYVSVNIQGGVR